MKKLDPSLSEWIDTMHAAYLRRLAQIRIEPTIPVNPYPSPDADGSPSPTPKKKHKTATDSAKPSPSSSPEKTSDKKKAA